MIKTDLKPAYADDLIGENTQTTSTALSTPSRRTLVNMMVSTALVGAAISPPSPAAAARGADAELLDLANQYIIAEQRYCDLHWQVEEMEEERGDPPEMLRILPSDAELGRAPWQATDEFWHRPCDLEQWRKLDEWVQVSKLLTDDRMEMVLERNDPPAQLRARAEQIVSAFDKWRSCGERPSGYHAAVSERDEAEEIYREIEETITETRATTVEGLFAKVRCAQAYMKKEGVIDGIEHGSAAETMAVSVFNDIQEMVSARPSRNRAT
jgi:hypothetical protein